MKHTHSRWIALMLLALFGVLSVSAQEDGMFGTVKGYASYREEVLLDDDSKLVVELFGRANDDSPAQVIASQVIMTGGRTVPFAFALNFDPSTINESYRYYVDAKIYVGDEVKWYTSSQPMVILNGQYEVEIRLLPIELSSYMEPPPTYELITGTVTYLQRIALPDDAVIEVQLLDVSRADAPAFVLASQQFVANGRQVPLNFALAYDPAGLREQGSYSVSAGITVGGRLRWISDTNNPVLTNGVSNIDIRLAAVDR